MLSEQVQIYFTAIASNLAIWLAYLASLIRVQNTLLASTCHGMLFFLALKPSFGVDIVAKNKPNVV